MNYKFIQHFNDHKFSEQMLNMPRVNAQEMCVPTEDQQTVLNDESKIDEKEVVKIAED